MRRSTTTPPRRTGTKHRIRTNLHRLATKSGEKSGLDGRGSCLPSRRSAPPPGGRGASNGPEHACGCPEGPTGLRAQVTKHFRSRRGGRSLARGYRDPLGRAERGMVHLNEIGFGKIEHLLECPDEPRIQCAPSNEHDRCHELGSPQQCRPGILGNRQTQPIGDLRHRGALLLLVDHVRLRENRASAGDAGCPRRTGRIWESSSMSMPSRPACCYKKASDPAAH